LCHRRVQLLFDARVIIPIAGLADPVPGLRPLSSEKPHPKGDV